MCIRDRLFLFTGDALLRVLGISLAAFRVSGGALLFLLAIDMVFARPSGLRLATVREQEAAQYKADISVFPLAFPLLAGPGALTTMDAVLVPGGFGRRGTEGKIAAIRHAREHKVPYLGICLGMQLAVVEFARDVAGLAGAHSTEFVQDTPYPVIGLITEWLDASGRVEKRGEDSDLGGTMRLGAQVCQLAEGSLAREIYGAAEITERHRHRYEVNNTLLVQLEGKGLRVAGRAPGTSLCEMIELPAETHPWFVGCQFHPEFTSNPRQGHPLFTSYVKAALANQQVQGR